MINFLFQKWNQRHFEENSHSVKYRCLVIQCNTTGHSGVGNYYSAYRPDPHACECFYAPVVYGCFKIEWHDRYDIWFNGNVWRLRFARKNRRITSFRKFVASILFGQPFEESKYDRIIEVCALREDFQRLPGGDQIVVGERGEVLSGGQQARVSLARAVYADGDIYLLDDPLSAVDFKVGQHIFNKCIKDLLGDKIVLFASHQQQHMENADEVIVLYKGRVLDKGRFTELHEKGVINSNVDPLYKAALKNKIDSSWPFSWEDKEEHDVVEKCQKKHPLPNEAKILEIAKEDRTIEVVTSKLYWDYFRSGAHPLMITGMVGLSLLTQGKLIVRVSYKRWVRP